MTRAKVKIFIGTWNEVDNDVKEKTYVLRDFKTRWKDFKSRLTHDYFTAKIKNEENHPPWEVYVGIDKDDWIKFKKIRDDDKFKAISKKNRFNQQKNDHPHLLGRGGYSKRDEQYVKEQMKKSILSSASSSGLESDTSTVRMVSPRPRYERWRDGRTNKKGEITNPKTKLVGIKFVT